MNDLLAALDRLLALLPFNGSKTLIGIALHAAVPVAATFFPPLAVAAPLVTALSDGIIAVGAIHQSVKKVVPAPTTPAQ